jgi:hypothetical protein
MTLGLDGTTGMRPRYLRDKEERASMEIATNLSAADPVAAPTDLEDDHDASGELLRVTADLRQRITEATVTKPSRRRPIVAAVVALTLLAGLGVAFPEAIAAVTPSFTVSK